MTPRALRNLLDLAVRFGPPHGRPETVGPGYQRVPALTGTIWTSTPSKKAWFACSSRRRL